MLVCCRAMPLPIPVRRLICADGPETTQTRQRRRAGARLGRRQDARDRAADPRSTTFIRDPDNQYRSGRIYARDRQPGVRSGRGGLTALEGGRASLLFASGMAAATAVFQALAPGDHVLAPKVMYWSLRNWLMDSPRTGD